MRKYLLFCILLFSFIINVNAEEIKLGTYKIIYAKDESKMLVDNNGNIELGNIDNDSSWDVYSDGSCFYIRKHDDRLSIDVSGGIRSNGINIQTYRINNSNAQKWKLNYAGNSYYYITSSLGNYNIDVSGGSIALGANIQLYQSNGTMAQKWKFEKIFEEQEILEEGIYQIRSKNNSGNIIGLNNLSLNNRTNIETRSINYDWSQLWDIKYENNYYTISSHLNSNKVMDISGGIFSLSSNVQLFQANGTKSQEFLIHKNSDNTYSIRSFDGLWTFDILWGSTNPGANIQLYQANGTAAQKFVLEKVELSDIEDGYYNISLSIDDNMVLGVNNKALFNGKNVDLREKTDNNYTKWYVKRVEKDIYTIANADNKNLVLDVFNNNKTNKTNIQLYRLNNSAAQKWIIRKNVNDTYTFIGVGSLKAIDVDNASTVAGTNIHIYEPNYRNAQKFKIIKTEVSEYSKEYEDGKYIIKSVDSNNKVLDISNASKTNGTNVQVYSLNNTKAQIWKITYNGNGEYIISSLINPKIVLTSDNNNVVSSRYLNNDNQKWFFDKNGDNTLIINKATGKYLKINDGNVILTDDFQSASKFNLESYTNTIVYKGIDVSKHNGNINWANVANSVDFVIIRAGFADETFLSNGVDKYEDVNYITNVENCEKYNIPYALYFYSYANKVNNADRPSYNKINGESAESEASHMLNLLKKITSKGYYPPMNTAIYFDQEDDSILAKTKDKNVLTGMINKFCGIMNNNGHKCGVYASKYWFTDRINVNEVADKHSIWVAQWPGYNSFDNALSSKSSYTTTPHKLWQFSSEGRVGGISTYVDLDLGYNIFE